MHAAFVDNELKLYAATPFSVEVPGAVWRELPDDFDPDVSSVELDGDGIKIVSLAAQQALLHARTLRILKHLPRFADVGTTDFTLLGFKIDPWQFIRGARTVRHYYEPTTNEIVVTDRYGYVMDGNNRHITGVTRTLSWLRNDGAVGYVKDVSPRLNKKAVKQLNRDIRQGRMDFLEASAEELLDMADVVPEPYASQYRMIGNSMNDLFDHYREESTQYVARGTDWFEDAIREESDPSILGILAIPTAPPSAQFPAGLTVKGSLLYQITGWPE